MGDFNIDLLKYESSNFSNRFSEQMFTSSFFPLITKLRWPTSANATQCLLNTTTYFVKHDSRFTKHNKRLTNHNNKFTKTHH